MIINAAGNENYNAIEIHAYRSRNYGETEYWVSVVPVMVDSWCVRSICFDGYKQTLATAKRASKKAETEAMAQVMEYVPRMIYKVCKEKDLTITQEYDLSTIVFKAN